MAVAASPSIAAFRQRSARSLNVNVFRHTPAKADASREAACRLNDDSVLKKRN